MKEINIQSFSLKEIELIRVLQEDIPLNSQPFCKIAEQLNMPEHWIYRTLRKWKDEKKLRSIQAILYHQRAGYTSNAMLLLAVPEVGIEKAGKKIASFTAVSHCYHRQSLPGWMYNLYAMLHARSWDELETVAEEICRSVNIKDYKILYSVREFKKRSMKYFVSEIEGENESPLKSTII
ncbi:MAG: siroheme decarboxylase subunit beta [Candidatus Humimicrobiaceae bacterium]